MWCALRRRRICDPDARNFDGAGGATCIEASQLGVRRDNLLREKNVSASFGIACYPLHGSSPQELIQVADASMYLSKHQGGNAVSTADHFDPGEAKNGKKTCWEAYLGVNAQTVVRHRPGRIRRDLPAAETVHGISCSKPKPETG